MKTIYIPDTVLQEIFRRSKTEKITNLYREFNLQDTISYAQLCYRIRKLKQKERKCCTIGTSSSQNSADVLPFPSPTPFKESFLRRLVRAIKCLLS